MSFFSPKKPAIKKGSKGDSAAFTIGYYKSKAPEEYKKRLIARLMEEAPCLTVVNSKFMYKEQKLDYLNVQEALLTRLDAAGVKYKSITVTRKDDISYFGVTVKRKEDDFYEDRIIGIVVDNNRLEAVSAILKNYNLYYYLGEYSEEELLERFEADFENKEKLGQGFKYTVFDDSFMKNIVLYCKKEAAGHIEDLLESI